MREIRVRSLGRKDPLEKEMAIHSSILAWRIPWMEKPRRLQSTGSQRVGHDWATSPYLTLPYLTLPYEIYSQCKFQVHTTLILTNSPYYTHLNVIHNPILKVLRLLIISFWVGTHNFSRKEATVFSFSWQSNKTIFFYFTQNFVSKIHFCTRA